MSCVLLRNGGLKENRASTLVSTLKEYRYIVDTTYLVGTDEATQYINDLKEAQGDDYVEPSYYRPSFMLLYKDGLYLQVNTLETTTTVSAQYGDWANYKSTENLLTRLLGADPKDISYDKDANGDYMILRTSESEEVKGNVVYTSYGEAVFKRFKTVLNESYVTTRNKNTLFNSLIYLGVYFVLIAFMGLLMFIITRGKDNQMNYLSYWVCTKLAMWSSLAPAILAMIVGFIVPNWAQFAFILLFGLRSMWMSMRTLRPLNQ